MLVGANFAYRDWPHTPGSGLHGEMEVLVEAGIPVAEVLRMTTIGNASFLGVDADGVAVVPGARADLLLLESDPMASIEATRRIAGVVLRGRWIDADEARALREADARP
jgi:imidazolonepropionase-like amidohydrolase